MKKIALSVALLAAFACANDQFELTGVVGGVKTFDEVDFDKHMTFGARFGIPANTFLTDQIELGYDYSQDVDLKQGSLSSDIHRAYLNAVKEFSDSSTRPYFLAGVGYQYVDSDLPEKLEGAFGQYGVGLKHFVTDNFGIKGEIRHAISFESGHDSSVFYTLGLFGAFGGDEEPVVVAPPSPVVAPVVAQPAPAAVPAKKIVLSNEHFNFASDSAMIKEKGMQVLSKVAEEIKDNNVEISINGYTDSTGSEKYNLALSEKRANTTKDALVGLGVAGDKIVTKGYGEANPIAPNNTADGRAQNRRVEIIFDDIK